MKELKVEKVYISKQVEKTDNYERFLNIVNEKNIEVYEVIAGNRICIDNSMYFDILWPTNNQITTNTLNNNAIICNFHYKNFSMLFTGDIEQIAENQILNLYKNNKQFLKADILKVGHHRF